MYDNEREMYDNEVTHILQEMESSLVAVIKARTDIHDAESSPAP